MANVILKLGWGFAERNWLIAISNWLLADSKITLGLQGVSLLIKNFVSPLIPTLKVGGDAFYNQPN